MPLRGPGAATRRRGHVTDRSSAAKRLVARIYDRSARRLYEPIVVRRAFPLLGGSVNDLALIQGREAVRVAAGRPILDMPVGTAHFTVKAARQHLGIVVGADIAEGMVREAGMRAEREALANLHPVQADAHALPFADGAFAAVLCTNGLQVIPGLVASVRELARVLAPGGMLYVSVITVGASRPVPRRARQKLPTFIRPDVDVARALSDAGFYIARIERSRLATLIDALKRD